ncbi:MFS transporter [Streptomyces sp. XD-27]|uniref:MFS transporter n=1 Tax=Streptomyces sp. XD-27 TaxID=3062779 RepID=UPI0026F40DA4|nr:MFS transporter [Streptomyces sp. XD-27]WKX71662.1 MFS transporter [Streptomyces sp. XD-27]
MGGSGTRPGPPPGLLLTVVALCTAVTAANIYLAAPLLDLIARDFGVGPSAAGWIASIAQVGYAAGLLLFAPLGDTADRRRLVGVLSVVAGVGLVGAGLAPGLPALAAAVLVACAATVVPQLLVPLVAERAPADRRGRHVGAIVAGLFTGIVAARVLGGLAGQAYGWRAVFLGAAGLTALVGVLTAVLLPGENRPRGAASPLRGIARVPRVLADSPELRRACLRQGGMYGAWSALWTALVLLLTGPEYGFSTGTAGLFGLFGLTASLVAPLSGSLVDRFGAARVVGSAYTAAAVAVPLFWLGERQLWALCAAAVLIHAGLVAGQVANQTRALTATNRPATANTAYVVAAFLFGAAASALAAPAYEHMGWGGVCAVAAAWLLVGWAAAAHRPAA